MINMEFLLQMQWAKIGDTEQYLEELKEFCLILKNSLGGLCHQNTYSLKCSRVG